MDGFRGAADERLGMRPGGLCVSLTPESIDDIFAADVAGADCVEVRLDYLKNPQQSAATRWDRFSIPVIVTCRGKEQGGRFEGSIEEELRILDHAARNGARFIDVDYRYARPFANAEVIASFHDFTSTPPNLDQLLDRICATDAQIAKIATTANSWSDNRRLLDLLSRKWRKPVIVIGMGDVGQITRVVGPSRGSFLTYASSSTASAPGQLSIREMLDVYHFPNVRRSAKLFGVLGYPLGHSLSPVLHNSAFAELGVDAVYLKFPTTDVADFFSNARLLGIEGVSVTIPHKSAVVPFLSGQSPESLEAGAVNTVFTKDGEWLGENSDIHGVRCALARAGFDPAGKSVVILGSGGASKAAQVAVKDAGRLTVLSRREVQENKPFDCDLLINATPVGMHPAVDASPVDGPIRASVVFDMVYNPPITRLLRTAADQGKTIIPGTAMFLAQAARQFEIWTGLSAPQKIFDLTRQLI